MGIRFRNLGEQHIILKAGEPAAADDHLDVDVALFDYFIKNVHAECLVVGATGTTAIDVNRNLVSILAAVINFTADLIPTSYPAFAGAQDGKKGDKFSLDLDTVETTVPQGLFVYIVLARKNPGAATNVTPANLK